MTANEERLVDAVYDRDIYRARLNIRDAELRQARKELHLQIKRADHEKARADKAEAELKALRESQK